MVRGLLNIGVAGALGLAAGSIAMAASPASASVPGVTCPGGGYRSTPSTSPGERWAGCDLESADLDNADLPWAYLRDSDLSTVPLLDADLAHADLTGADLADTFLQGAGLGAANLAYANLAGVQSGGITGTPAALPANWSLQGGYLIGPGADLNGADLAGLDLSGDDLTGVESGGITGIPAALPAGWSVQNGYLIGPGANLLDANLADTNLSGVDLSAANLNGVESGAVTGAPAGLPANWSFVDGYLVGPRADLNDAALSGASLTGADLAFATLAGADLSNADLTGADLSDNVVYEGQYSGDGLQGANLSGANLTNADLSGVNLSGANVMSADFGTASLTGLISGGVTGTPSSVPASWSVIGGYLIGPAANLAGAGLSGLNLSTADLTGVRSGSIRTPPAALPAGWSDQSGYLVGPGADLTFARLKGISLAGVDLTGADMTGVTSGSITGTPSALPAGWILATGYLIGPGAELLGSSQAPVNLAGVNLSAADLTGVTGEGITGSPSALPPNWSIDGGFLIGPGANLQRMQVQGLSLAGADLAGANLVGAPLSGDNLSGADLSGADLADALVQDDDLSGANLVDADLTEVESGTDTGSPALPSAWALSDGYLIGPGANLSGANLTGVSLSGANLTATHFSFASLGSTDLSGAQLDGADLTGADLTGANLTGASVTGATLSAVTWSGTTCPDGTNSNAYIDGCFSALSSGTPADSPEVTAGTPGKSGWYISPVTATWNWSDAGPLNLPLCPESSTTTGNGTSGVTATCTDLAGHLVTETYAVKVDATGLSVSVAGVGEGRVYVLGAVPKASCRTTDTVSGVASPARLTVTQSGAHGIGAFTAACSGAVNVAGATQKAAVKVSYTVAAGMSGFSSPRPGSRIAKSSGKLTVRFRLTESRGLSISGTLARAMAAAHHVRVGLTGPGIKRTLASCGWDGSAHEFACTLRIPSGVRKGAKNHYSITAWENPSGGFIVVPAVRGGANPEIVSFR